MFAELSQTRHFSHIKKTSSKSIVSIIFIEFRLLVWFDSERNINIFDDRVNRVCHCYCLQLLYIFNNIYNMLHIYLFSSLLGRTIINIAFWFFGTGDDSGCLWCGLYILWDCVHDYKHSNTKFRL